MNPIVAKKFLTTWMLLLHEFSKAEKAEKRQIATDAERTDLYQALVEFQHQCYWLGLIHSNECCKSFLTQLGDPAWHHDAPARQAIIQGLPRPPLPKEIPLPSFETIYSELRKLIEKANREMDAIRLAAIYDENARFFEQDDLFGKEIKDSASSQLNAEIKTAGNCLAADLYTAAVFHLMRVAEHGLHALAKHILPAWNKPFPLEFSEWQDVLQAIDTELENQKKHAQQLTRGSAKDQELEFYDGLLKSIAYFKDAYRNPVSHLRGNYDRTKALVVFDEVKGFMQRLAKKVPLK